MTIMSQTPVVTARPAGAKAPVRSVLALPRMFHIEVRRKPESLIQFMRAKAA